MRKSKLLRQFLNVLLVYVLFSVLFTVVKIPSNAVSNEQSRLSDILWIWIRPVGVYWYLFVLMALYLFFAVSGITRRRQAMMLLVCIVLMVSSNYISGPFRISEILYYAFFFSAGIAYTAGFPVFSKWIGVILSPAISILLTVFCWRNETRLVDIHHVKALAAAGFSMTVWYVLRG